ncbi:DUF7224 domain-containing protein [Streptomyces bambusae]|uniref:DUF7224 domain-containing protein n=1 Tax=Streptomyces bambusae TaxID=1550616 RepID=A0ABS6Z5F7_9ACTN|nr:hypothetical protein [Streptomyces bambusae]MBW5482448.1 hypothetical protein [Streptomyces bambusae]
MLLRTLLRSSSATLMLPLLVCFIVFLLSDTLTRYVTEGYGPSAVGQASFVLAFAAAACAASAAWEGARLKRGGVLDQAPARGPLAIALPVLAPVWLMGLAGLATSLLIASIATGAPPAPSHLGMLGAQGLVLAACTLSGYLTGRLLPGIAAAPIALTVGFCLTAFPVSLPVAWPRHLVAGAFSECCSVGTVIDPKAVWAPTAFAVGVCAAALLLIRRPAFRSLVAAFLLVAVGTAAALPPALGLGFSPVTARDDGELVCDTRGRPHVCLWPEIGSDGQAVAQTRTFAARLEAAGLQIPATLTESRDLKPGEARFGFKSRPQSADIAMNLASAVLPGMPECARRTGTFRAYPARAPLMAWVTSVALQAPPGPGRLSPDDAALVQRVLQEPREKQLAWYEANRQALATCDQPPQLTVPGGAG